MRKGTLLQRRGGIAGIIAALILFVILFTVGTGYFLWISNNNSTLSQAQASRVDAVQQQGLEELQVVAGYCGYSPCNGDLTFTVQNTGDVAVTLQSDFVNIAGGTCTNPLDPVDLSLNPGAFSTPIDTGCAYTGTTAVIKVLTQRGDVFSATYSGSEISTSLSANPVMAGSSVFDTAALTDVSPTASGTVVYSYFPEGDANCAGNGILVSIATVVNGAVPDSATQIFNTAGSYSWNATYGGDSNNPPAKSLCEPLTVLDSITTQLSSAKIVVGNPVYDSATLTGVTTNAGGKVSYYDYTNGVCSTGQTLVATVTVSSGSVPSSGYSSAYTTGGLYSWDAVYAGDGVNQPATSPCEPLIVVPGITTSLSSSTIYQLGSAYDSAVLGGVTAGASGNVTYYYSTTDACPTPVGGVGGATQVGKPVKVTGGVVPNSVPVQFTSAGNYYWYAVYTGDSNNYPSTSPCEQLTVLPESGGGGTGSLQQVVGSFKFYFTTCNQSSSTGNPDCLGDGTNVGGYYGYGLSMSTAGSDCPAYGYFDENPSCVNVVFQISLTNTDPTRSITLGPQSLLWLQGTCQTAAENGEGGYFFARGECSSTNYFSDYALSQGYWIVNGPLTSSGQGATPLPYTDPVTIAPGAVATLYFYCGGPCTNSLVSPAYNPPPGTYVEASLDLYGLYSDNTPFGQNIPFIATYISPVQIVGCATGATYSGTNSCWSTASQTQIAAAPGTSITLAVDGLPCTSVTTEEGYGHPAYECSSGDSFPLYVNWVSSTGGVTQVGENPSCDYSSQVSGGSPGYCTVTFQVPSTAAPGTAYAIYVTSDGVNNAYATVSGTGGTSTSVSCTPAIIQIGGASTCTATVTGNSPTGTVTWSQSPSGIVTFSSATCTLTGGTCSVTVTGKTAGQVTITAAYSGDSNNQPSSGQTTLDVTSLVLSPAQGPAGVTVTVTGLGFTPDTSISTFTFNAATPSSQTCTTQTTSSTGGFTCTFVVPVVGHGTYTVVATGSDSSTDTSSAAFTVTVPAITLSPTQGPVGTSVSVTGSGFTPGIGVGSISITGGTVSTQTCTSQVTSATGGFTCTFTVPTDTAGAQSVTVAGSDVGTVTADSATAMFTITTSSITLNPTSGPVGTTVTVTGTSFIPDSTITIKFDGTTLATTPATVTTSAAGGFTATFVVPASTAGGQTVTASDGTNTGSATFTVTPKITLTPTSGPVGTTVTVTGSGFAGGSKITVTFNGATVITSPATVTTSATGGFTATFAVPTSTTGSKTVTATDASSNAASATFTVSAAKGLDSSCIGFGSTTSASFSLTLPSCQANDVVILVITQSSGSSRTFTISDSAHVLTFTLRGDELSSSGGEGVYEYWATNPTSLASDTITISTSSSHSYDAEAFGVTGASTSSPYDSNGGLPYSSTGFGSHPTVTGISTSNANDVIIALEGDSSGTTETAGTGFTLLATHGPNSQGLSIEYEIVSSTLTSTTVSFGTTSGAYWVMMVDAIDPPAGQSALGPPLVSSAGTVSPMGELLVLGIFIPQIVISPFEMVPVESRGGKPR